MKRRRIQKRRAELAVLITRKVFPKYKHYVSASTIVQKLHPMLLANRPKFTAAFTKRVAAPLHRITDDAGQSKRHVISFLRRLASYYGNTLTYRTKSVVVNGCSATQYEYALIKVK